MNRRTSKLVPDYLEEFQPPVIRARAWRCKGCQKHSLDMMGRGIEHKRDCPHGPGEGSWEPEEDEMGCEWEDIQGEV